MDDSELSGEKENAEGEESSDVFQNEKLKEEKQKVAGMNGKDQVEAYDKSSSNITDDGSDNDLSNLLVTFGKEDSSRW